jgi:hypothetical protein
MIELVLALKVVTTCNRRTRPFPQDGDSGTEPEDDEETTARNDRREQANHIELHDPVMQVRSIVVPCLDNANALCTIKPLFSFIPP